MVKSLQIYITRYYLYFKSYHTQNYIKSISYLLTQYIYTDKFA